MSPSQGDGMTPRTRLSHRLPAGPSLKRIDPFIHTPPSPSQGGAGPSRGKRGSGASNVGRGQAPKESNDNSGRVQFTQNRQTQNGSSHNADQNSVPNAGHNSVPTQAMSNNNSISGNQVMGDDNSAQFGPFLRYVQASCGLHYGHKRLIKY